MKLLKLPRKLWAGFVDGKVDIEPALGGAPPNAAPQFYGVIYTTRRTARRSYDDVRCVQVREIRSKRGKK